MTYAVNGRQFLAVVSGKGGNANPASLSYNFFKDLRHHNSSGMLFAFGLP
jgi:hypothetical protein